LRAGKASSLAPRTCACPASPATASRGRRFQYERRLDCDSPEGRLICDEIVPAGEMDAALDRVVEGLTNSGVVSAASNRRAIRITQEPLDTFRAYFALYAREQAYCHFSPALIGNLERYWNAQSRTP
jgi:thioesterase DpgC